MMFVTVGTHNLGFERLIKKIDEIAPEIDDEVVLQIGHTSYVPRNVEFFKFIEYEKILDLIKKSDVIICHGGAGTLLDILNFNKRVIVVPRLKEYGEVYDNHELELAESLKERNIVELVSEVELLKSTISEFIQISYSFQKDFKLIKYIKKSLNGFEHENCNDNF